MATTWILAILNALVAIPKIAEYVKEVIAAVVIWYLQTQKTETLSQIADAAAFSARAQTEEDRYLAAEKWQKALSRPRITA